MLLKECAWCRRLIPYGSTYCPDCAPIVETAREARLEESIRESNRRYNRKRDPKYTRFYHSKEWRTMSRARLIEDGYKCVKCGAFASEVDHIVPIQTPEGWDRRLDFSNTQSLCVTCHNAKHDRFKKRTPKGV